MPTGTVNEEAMAAHFRRSHVLYVQGDEDAEVHISKIRSPFLVPFVKDYNIALRR